MVAIMAEPINNDPKTPGINPPEPGISPADVDALLNEMNSAQAAESQAVAQVESATTQVSDIDALLNSATFENAGSISDQQSLPLDVAPDAIALDLPELQRAMADAQASSIDLLRDVELDVKIELGRSQMLVENVLKLGEGSVVELDKLAGDPVDVFVNDRLVARGEVLVLNDQFCVRVNEIIATREAE